MATLDATEITPMDLRARTGDILDHVRLRNDVFVITRRGVPMAALVPVERLKLMEEVARKYSRLVTRIQADHVRSAGLSSKELDEAAIRAVKRVRARRK
jgi:prevent-host-death family protein